jgi:hypothetical protein
MIPAPAITTALVDLSVSMPVTAVLPCVASEVVPLPVAHLAMSVALHEEKISLPAPKPVFYRVRLLPPVLKSKAICIAAHPAMFA